MAEKQQEQMVSWRDAETLFLPPVVTVETAPKILRQVVRDKKPVLGVDFSNVTQADSVALAMLLAWQSQMESPLKVFALPDELKTLIHLYDLEGALHI